MSPLSLVESENFFCKIGFVNFVFWSEIGLRQTEVLISSHFKAPCSELLYLPSLVGLSVCLSVEKSVEKCRKFDIWGFVNIYDWLEFQSIIILSRTLQMNNTKTEQAQLPSESCDKLENWIHTVWSSNHENRYNE